MKIFFHFANFLVVLPYRMLSFYTEEESCGEVVHIVHAYNMIISTFRIKVTVNYSDQIPEHSKDQPGEEE